MIRKLREFYSHPQATSFLLSMLIFGTAVGIVGAVLNNYLFEILSINRVERGMIELPREMPGLLLILVMAVLWRFSEMRLMYSAMLVSFAGLVGLAIAGATRTPAILFIVAWSMGEHLLMPVRSSIGIHMARKGKEGVALGGVSSAGNIGQVLGHYIVPVLFLVFPLVFRSTVRFDIYRTAFIAAAVVLAAGIFLASRLKTQGNHITRPRIYFRKKYLKYYILEAFFGARKQVFFTFAPYVLIINYGARTELIASLYGLWSIANIFLGPAVGKLIDKVGYKKVIVADAAILMILCLLYGYSHLLFSNAVAFVVVCCVFVLDAILFIAGLARTVYIKSISDNREEVTSTLSTGISINHLISIVIAVAGGLLWERLGMETLFSLAAVFGLGSLLFAGSLPRHTRSQVN